MLVISIGFTLGFLSEDPDGLERVLIDAYGGAEEGEEWLEGLSSPWDPIFGGIESDYIAGLIGILLSFVIIMAVFFLIVKFKKKEINQK